MSVSSKVLPMRTEEDLMIVRQTVKAWMIEQKFSLLEQTKLVTAISEIGRNALVYGGGGSALLEQLLENCRVGIRVTIEDQGPGIADIEQALQDAYSTGNGLGFGLSGAKRLVMDFDICSKPGQGTRIKMTVWN
ncbi:MAG: hypothetical protein RI893_1057 [Pseudomonadota bacterium]|jgi:serine/threonine-protein kinase RsbT